MDLLGAIGDCDGDTDELCESDVCDYDDTATGILCAFCPSFAALGCTEIEPERKREGTR